MNAKEITLVHIGGKAMFYTGLAVSCALSALSLSVYAGMWWTTLYGAARGDWERKRGRQ